MFIITKQDLEAQLNELNTVAAIVHTEDGFNVLDLRNPNKAQILTQKNFIEVHAHKKVSIAGNKTKTLPEIWLEWPGRRLFTGELQLEQNSTPRLLKYYADGNTEVLTTIVDAWILTNIQVGWFQENGPEIKYSKLKDNFYGSTGLTRTDISITMVGKRLRAFGFNMKTCNGSRLLIVPSVDGLNRAVQNMNSGVNAIEVQELNTENSKLSKEVQELKQKVEILSAQVEAQDQIIRFLNK